MLQDTHDFLDEAAAVLDIPGDTLKKLKRADAEHIFDIELGSGKKFQAFRVQHNNQRGPYKGGIRFHPNVTLDEVRTLATLMSLKTAAAGLPLGGGKGGVTVDPRALDKAELEELSRKYARHLQPHIGPKQDIPAPDVNTDPTIIDWMVDEYEKITGDTSKASFTGKSINNGGSAGRDTATGRGGVLALGELLKLEHADTQTLTYAVQGYGNVGSFFAVTARKLYPGWRLVAASDSEAAVYRKQGLDAAELQKFKESHGRFKDFKDGRHTTLSNDELLALDVDVLVLAGMEDAVTDTNAPAIKAKYIVEMANGPITKKAFEYLKQKRRIILPDIIANAGGVVVSYLEWDQNLRGEHWPEQKVYEQLSKYIKKAIANTYDFATSHNLSLKEAAFARALERIQHAGASSA